MSEPRTGLRIVTIVSNHLLELRFRQGKDYQGSDYFSTSAIANENLINAANTRNDRTILPIKRMTDSARITDNHFALGYLNALTFARGKTHHSSYLSMTAQQSQSDDASIQSILQVNGTPYPPTSKQGKKESDHAVQINSHGAELDPDLLPTIIMANRQK